MLSIGKLAGGSQAEKYYTRSVASGREDYYAGRGEAPGRWTGAGAADLGFESDREVSEAELTGLFRGQDPATGAVLRELTPAGVAGFDVTFHAPKSVSVLYAIGARDVIEATREAHDAAVAEALGYLEREACRTRFRRNGRIVSVPGKGFIAAAFRHRTSRAGDPQLHTHVVIGNLTQRANGAWGALDGRLLYRHGKTASYLYQAVLRAELTERLGVAFTPVHNGIADVIGVPENVVRHFSKRRAEIVEHMRSRGEHSARAAQIAALQTRKRKQYDIPVDRLREEWRARAAEHGLGPAELADVLASAERFDRDQLDLSRCAAQLAGAQGVTREASTFDRRHVIQAWAERHRDGAKVSRIEQLSDAWLASESAIRLAPKRGRGGPREYSTPEMLSVERDLLRTAECGTQAARGIADDNAVERAIAARPTISDEQAEMVRRLARDGHGVQVVRAAAGTGKTFALDAAREAWEASGLTVVGCSLSARAATELHDQTGMPTSTLRRVSEDLHHGYGFSPGSVLVVDEAGMVGTRDLAELAAHTAEAEAKLVLVGDDRQLPEIQAGGAFRALARQEHTITLTEVRRQAHEWDRNALADLRDGKPDRWAQAYGEHGRLRGAHNAEHTRAALVDDWWQATHEHPTEDNVMIAHRRSDVADLNRRARERMHRAGRLADEELQINGRGFAVGDRVITTRNDRRLGLSNGTRAEIAEIDFATGDVHVHTRDGERQQIPNSYLHDGNLDHAYATTAHRAQGATVDRAFVLGSDDLYREWGYTALTRHRDTAMFYVNLGDGQQQLPGVAAPDDDWAEIDAILSRSHAKHLAHDRGIPETQVAPHADDVWAQLAREPRQLGPEGPADTGLEL
jgi:Ti-type conjugative transfer relaxase TraA